MSALYTISIENNRGANSNYAVFMEPPKFSAGQEPFMNVWYTSFVPYHGTSEVRTGTDFYPWTGTVPLRPQPGVIVSNGMSLLGNLGTDSAPGSTFELNIIDGFPTLTEVKPSAGPGAFEIDTGDDFSMPNDTYVVGLAKVNNRGQVVPVAAMAPLNKSKIQITPKMKFFITESQSIPGEIVDYNSVSRDGATIDFTSGEGKGKFFARVVHGNDGKFKVTYFDNFDD